MSNGNGSATGTRQTSTTVAGVAYLNASAAFAGRYDGPGKPVPSGHHRPALVPGTVRRNIGGRVFPRPAAGTAPSPRAARPPVAAPVPVDPRLARARSKAAERKRAELAADAAAYRQWLADSYAAEQAASRAKGGGPAAGGTPRMTDERRNQLRSLVGLKKKHPPAGDGAAEAVARARRRNGLDA